MKKVFFLLILFACDHQGEKHVCSCEQMNGVKHFVSDNVKGANNMSLEITGVRTNCPQKVFWMKSGSRAINWEKHKLDSCQTVFDY